MAGVNVIPPRGFMPENRSRLLAIDGYYQTAEQIDATLRNQRLSVAGRRRHENYTTELTE